MTKNLKKIIICGLGSIGKRHLKIIKKNFPEIEVGLVRSNKSNKGINDIQDHIFFNDINESLKWLPDAAIISSPATFHFEHATPFIKNDIPVLIEKPIDTDEDNMDKWEEIKSQYNSNILVGYVLRYDPAFAVIKDFINKSKLGHLINVQMINSSWLPSWRKDIDYKNSVSSSKLLGGGILLEQSHDINLATSLFGECKTKYANILNKKILDLEVEEIANINLINENNLPINIHIDFCSRPLIREIYIRGSYGHIRWDIANGNLKIETIELSQPLIYSFPIDPDSRLLTQLKHFIEIAKGEVKPLVSLNDSLKTLNLIKEIRNFKDKV